MWLCRFYRPIAVTMCLIALVVMGTLDVPRF